MEPNTNQLSQLFEGLSATGVRTILWDENDNLLHADPGMLEIYQNEEFNEKFGKVELTEGMGWRKWTEQEITLGIIEVPEDLDQESFLNKLGEERQNIKDRRSRELTFKNGVTVLSTDIRLKDGGLFTSFTDITEQKQNNEKLTSLSQALDSTDNTTFIFDKDGRFVYGNKSFHDLQNNRGLPVHEGMTHDEWLRRLVEKGIFTVPEGMTAEEHLANRKAIRDNIDRQYTVETGRSDGTWVLDTTTRLDDESLITVVSDITKQKKQELELIKSIERNQFLAGAMDKSSNTIFILDSDYRFVFANSQFLKITEEAGFEYADGRLWVDFFRQLVRSGWMPSGDMDEDKLVQNRLDELKALETSIVEERTTLGGERLLATSRLDDGGLVQIHTDVTDLKQMNKTVSMLSDAMNKSNNGIMITDANDKVVFANSFVKERMQKAGISFTEQIAYSEHIRKFIEAGIVRLPKGLAAIDFIASRIKEREKITEQDSRELDTEMGARIQTTTRLDDGGLVMVSTDISDLKKNNEALERLLSAMQEVPNGMMLWDRDDKLVFANDFVQNMQRQRGSRRFEIGNRWVDLQKSLIDDGVTLIPAGKSAEEFLEELSEARLALTGQQVRTRTTGEGLEFLLTDTRLDDGGIVTIVTDVTELRKQEADLQRLRTANDFSSVGTMFWDENDVLIYANKNARETNSELGVPVYNGMEYSELARGLVENKVIPVDDGLSAEEMINAMIQSRTAVVFDKNKENEPLTFERVLSDRTYLASHSRLEDGSLFTTYSEITELKKHELELARLNTATDYSSVGTLIWNKDDVLIYFNRSAHQFGLNSFDFEFRLGASYDEVARRQVETVSFEIPDSMTDEEFIAELKSQRASILYNENEDSVAESFERVVGDDTYLFSYIRLKDGSLFQAFTDITGQKRRESELQRLSDGINSISNGLVFWDENQNLVFCNAVATEFSKKQGFDMRPGVNRLDMRKQFIATGMRPGESDKEGLTENKIQQQLMEMGTTEREQVYSDGTVLLFSDKTFPDGSVISVYTDITERKRREEVNRRLTEALEQIPNGLLFWDKDDNLIGVNRMVKKLWDKFGVALDVGQPRSSMRDQFLSNNAIIFSSEESKEQRMLERQKSWQKIEGQQVRETEFADGTILLFNDTRLKDGSTLSFASNITELKKREKDLELAKIEADEANEAKSQFLANMSHELRTPLNAVIGLTEMLKEDAEDDNLEDYLEPLDRIHNASRHLLTLINDVLDLSKIEAGKIELYFEQFLVSDIMRDIMATSEPLAQKNNNELILKNNLDFDSIHSDQTRVRQIVLNLVSNACKFTENGQVTIALASRMDGEKKFLDIAITDTGIGMSEAQVNKLFQAFTQADSSTTRKYGGTGLGLIITKHLSRIMGGDVDVSSVEGEGTTFTASIIINANNAENVQADAIKYDALVLGDTDKLLSTKAEHTILIIDDDPTVRDLMKRQLERDGFGVLIAEDGPLGIKMAIEMQPDAVVLDILMPGMDGWSVLRTLKASKETASIPVIMASILDEKNRGFSLGAADYLSKPVERDRLISSIEKLIGSGDGKTVFIIEDDEELRFLLREALSKEAYGVIEAENGKVALEELEAGVGSPDLILLDLNMPVMNGFEFLEIYREKFGNDVPIVVVTGADLTEKDKKFLSGEVTRILEKTPDTEGTIAGDVAKVLRNVRMG